MGVIAQEMRKVAPYTVNTFVYRKPELTDEERTDLERKFRELRVPESDFADGEELYSFDPSALDYLLVNAVKQRVAFYERCQQEEHAESCR